MGRGGISHFVVGIRYPYDYNCSEGKDVSSLLFVASI